jgi:hypothetical protein
LASGAAIGAALGLVGTGVMALWAVVDSSVIDPLVAGLMVAVGACAGAAIGLVATVLVAAVRPRSSLEFRTPRARWIVGTTMLMAVLGTAAAGIAGVGPLSGQLGVIETRVRPVAFVQAGVPTQLSVAVEWSEDGYCIGQFSVEVLESRSDVRISDVVSRAERNYWSDTACAGVGAVDGLAWVEVQLIEPLGGRRVVDDDGVELAER